jgi:hypothetical protein
LYYRRKKVIFAYSKFETAQWNPKGEWNCIFYWLSVVKGRVIVEGLQATGDLPTTY